MQVMNFLNQFRAKFDHNWKFVWSQVNTLQEKTGDSKVQPSRSECAIFLRSDGHKEVRHCAVLKYGKVMVKQVHSLTILN